MSGSVGLALYALARGNRLLADIVDPP